jgi:DNA-binding NarL/FixJ family response regulator
MPNEATDLIRNIQLPEAEERELQEELKATQRSASSIVMEALRLRRMVLEALGIEAAGTNPTEVANAAKRALEAGVRAIRAANKKAER